MGEGRDMERGDGEGDLAPGVREGLVERRAEERSNEERILREAMFGLCDLIGNG